MYFSHLNSTFYFKCQIHGPLQCDNMAHKLYYHVVLFCVMMVAC